MSRRRYLVRETLHTLLAGVALAGLCMIAALLAYGILRSVA